MYQSNSSIVAYTFRRRRYVCPTAPPCMPDECLPKRVPSDVAASICCSLTSTSMMSLSFGLTMSLWSCLIVSLISTPMMSLRLCFIVSLTSTSMMSLALFDCQFDFDFDYEFEFLFDYQFDFDFDYEFDLVFHFGVRTPVSPITYYATSTVSLYWLHPGVSSEAISDWKSDQCFISRPPTSASEEFMQMTGASEVFAGVEDNAHCLRRSWLKSRLSQFCARAARGVQGGAESSTFLESWKKTAGKRIAYAKVTSFEDYLDTVIIIGLPIIGHKL
ncbi:unnamed protein product, partial [Nesidiocoris tenuis]